MLIQIKLFSSLRKYLPESELRKGWFEWELPDGWTIQQALSMLGVPDEQAAILLVNGRKADRSRRLADGDVFHVFPPIMGG